MWLAQKSQVQAICGDFQAVNSLWVLCTPIKNSDLETFKNAASFDYERVGPKKQNNDKMTIQHFDK